MVTMSSEKSASRRKPIENNDTRESSSQTDETEENHQIEENVENQNTPTHRVTACCAEDTPNYLVYKKVSPRVISSLSF